MSRSGPFHKQWLLSRRGGRISPVRQPVVVDWEGDTSSVVVPPDVFPFMSTTGNPYRIRNTVNHFVELCESPAVVLTSKDNDIDTRGLDPALVAVLRLKKFDTEGDRAFDETVLRGRTSWWSSDLHHKRMLARELGAWVLWDDDIHANHPHTLRRMYAAYLAGGRVVGMQPLGYEDRSVEGHIELRFKWKYTPQPSGSICLVDPAYFGCFLPIYNEDRFFFLTPWVFGNDGAAIEPLVLAGRAIQLSLARVSQFDAMRAYSQKLGDYFLAGVEQAADQSSRLWLPEYWEELHRTSVDQLKKLKMANSRMTDDDQKDVDIALLRLERALSEVDPLQGLDFVAGWSRYQSWSLDPDKGLFSRNPRYEIEQIYGSVEHPLLARFNGSITNVASGGLVSMASRELAATRSMAEMAVYVENEFRLLAASAAQLSASRITSRVSELAEITSVASKRSVGMDEITKLEELGRGRLSASGGIRKWQLFGVPNAFDVVQTFPSCLSGVRDWRDSAFSELMREFLSLDLPAGAHLFGDVSKTSDTQKQIAQNYNELFDDCVNAGLGSTTIGGVLLAAAQPFARLANDWAMFGIRRALDSGTARRPRIPAAPAGALPFESVEQCVAIAARDAMTVKRFVNWQGRLDGEGERALTYAALMFTRWDGLPRDVHRELCDLRSHVLKLVGSSQARDAFDLLVDSAPRYPVAFSGLPLLIPTQLGVGARQGQRALSRLRPGQAL